VVTGTIVVYAVELISCHSAPLRKSAASLSIATGRESDGSETTIYVGGLLEKLTTATRTHWTHLIATPSG
jgi:hypothetical protein